MVLSSPLGPRPSRPCASSLISALRLLAHLGLAPSRSSRPCASSAHLFDSGMVHGDVAPYFAAAAPSLLAPLARPAPPPPLALAAPLVQHLTRRLLATRPTPRSRRLIPGDAPYIRTLLVLKTGELLVERRRGPVVPNLPLARWCFRLHLDLARLGPAPPRSSRPCASSGRLSSILQLIAEKTLRRISHALPAAPHPSRIPRMKLRTSCMRVFSSCPFPPHSASSLGDAISLLKNDTESFFWTSPRAYRGVARTK